MIDGVVFKLKDLTLDEVDEINKLISVTAAGEVTVGNESSKKFLSIVLQKVNKDDKEVDFGKCSEKTAIEVLKDFFIGRIESASELKTFFTDYAQKQKKSLKNING